ncbi:MAG TPA: thiamine pyrophosphate-dependent enzyme [Puia sp.]|jgi:pyruvate dehydrogenase (quinone)/pyruvate oxidase/pyruvate decarboxylase|nr:thiamine pyrophosphate-dependent enzyme [Puia sp.]
MQNISLTVAGTGIVSSLAAENYSSSKKNNLMNELSKPADESQNTSDILVQKLIDWKVEFVFGIIGDGVNPIIEALRKKQDKIKLITVRHEEAAAFMASGYAKYTGKLGVCIGTSGPGAVHLMNGIYDAAMEGAPVLAITGSVYHDLLGTYFTQEVDTVALMQDATVYNKMITGPRQAMTLVDLACRTALNEPGVAHLTVSKDVQQKILADDKPSANSENLTGSSAFLPRTPVPSDIELNDAATLLNNHSKIMILAGRGALSARDEVLQLAQKLNAPVAKALLGKMLLPDDSPFTTGGTGQLGTIPSMEMMRDCDLLLILGSNMPHLSYYPKSGVAKAIQIDKDPKRIGLRFPVNIGLCGDVKQTLQALLPKINQHNGKSFLQLAQQKMTEWKITLSKLEKSPSSPIKPEFVASEVSKLLAEDALLAFDTGAHTVFSARHIQSKSKQQLAVCGNLASMAPGLPYAIAAQIAYPNRQCVAMVGDGGFTMLMAEMATAVLYELPVKIIIFKNNQLSMDRFEQEEMGSKDYGINLLPIDFVKVSEACGAEGYSCKRAEDLPAILRRAFATKKPSVIEVMVDPDEPPSKPEKIKYNYQ